MCLVSCTMALHQLNLYNSSYSCPNLLDSHPVLQVTKGSMPKLNSIILTHFNSSSHTFKWSLIDHYNVNIPLNKQNSNFSQTLISKVSILCYPCHLTHPTHIIQHLTQVFSSQTTSKQFNSYTSTNLILLPWLPILIHTSI